jgi:hypothetical protein
MRLPSGVRGEAARGAAPWFALIALKSLEKDANHPRGGGTPGANHEGYGLRANYLITLGKGCKLQTMFSAWR